MQTEYKTCPKCKETKTRSEFYVSKVTSDGLHYCCKSCKKVYERQRYKLNPEERLARERTQKVSKPEYYLVTRAKCRAKKKGLPFDITSDDVSIPKYCPLLGVKLCIGKKKHTEASPSLDQIEPGKGYVKGNIWVISHRANKIKNDATPQELIQIGKVLVKLYPHLTTECPQLNPKQT